MYYACWFDSLYLGVMGLQYYDDEKQIWGQAHNQASWAIFQAVRQADSSMIEINFEIAEDGKDTFSLKFNRSKLRTVGFKAVCDFLHKIHVYKSIGDIETAETFFNHYS